MSSLLIGGASSPRVGRPRRYICVLSMPSFLPYSYCADHLSLKSAFQKHFKYEVEVLPPIICPLLRRIYLLFILFFRTTSHYTQQTN